MEANKSANKGKKNGGMESGGEMNVAEGKIGRTVRDTLGKLTCFALEKKITGHKAWAPI